MAEVRAKLSQAYEAERAGDIKRADALGQEAANKLVCAIGPREVVVPFVRRPRLVEAA